MDNLAEVLDERLNQWHPETSEEVKRWVAEIIKIADQDALDLLRSRYIEQNVLDLLDEPTSR